MKMSFVAVAALAIGALFTSCGNKAVEKAGDAILIRGEVSRVTGEKRVILKAGDVLAVGDRVETGADGVAVVEFAKNLGRVEIQPNAVFELDGRGKKTVFSAPRGNVWLKINKLGADEHVDLRTMTTVAGVRGTCFYTFHMGDLTGTCQCEGHTVYSNSLTGKVVEHDQDSITFTRGGKVVVVGAEDLAPLGFAHNHSVLEQSPLGPQMKNDPKIDAVIRSLAEKKFAALK